MPIRRSVMKKIYDEALLQICYFYDLVLYPRYYRLKRKFRKPLKGKITEEGIRRFNDALNKYGGLDEEPEIDDLSENDVDYEKRNILGSK